MSAEPPSFLPPGTPVDLDNCAREPIHLPGGVQSHGAVLVARAADRVIVQTSANIADVLLEPVDAVLGATLDHFLGPDVAARLAGAAQDESGPSVRVDRCETLQGTPLELHAFCPAPGLIGVDLELAGVHPADAAQIVTRVSGWGAHLAGVTSTEGIVAVAATALRELTGFDRTWAYRFEPDGHGVVVAEDRREDLTSFLGLHFPEGDIPRQARDLYLRSGVRVIHDAASTDAPLVPLENPETGAWLDLSGSGLRAVSPMHVRYLLNMGVRSSMSVPLVVGGKLWGLLSAHHYGAPSRVPFRVRGECELLGVMTSMQLAATTELAQAKARAGLQVAVSRVTEAAAGEDAFIDGLVADPDALLAVCGAAGCIVAISGEQRLVGNVGERATVDRIMAAVKRRTDDLVVTDGIGFDDPTVDDLAGSVSGIIAFALSRTQGNWIAWVRPETVHEVTWGNRDKSLVRRSPQGDLELGQRESFERWAEEVRGRATPWSPAEVESVRELRSALGSLLIARTERLARLNDELARSNDELDAFAYAAAHDLREPVRGVEQVADFLLEDHGDALGEDGRRQVETILRLSDRMDGLLSSLLTYAELGEAKWTRSRVHLPSIVDDVREMLAASLPPGASIDVDDTWVDADESGLRQLLLNLIWNATKYSSGPPVIRVGTRWLSQAEAGTPRVRRSLVSDHEPIAVFVEDEGIGIAPEHHEHVFALFRRLHAKDEFGGGHGAGLALCRRIVERHGGVMWVESELGQGARFWFTLAPT
ncbi:MAG: GAF domain-containing protein [Solirubrobacteraceae bacterium]|nr:GAF domain-containing protein [Solirubrobacteraceae bacterium]